MRCGAGSERRSARTANVDAPLLKMWRALINPGLRLVRGGG